VDTNQLQKDFAMRAGDEVLDFFRTESFAPLLVSENGVTLTVDSRFRISAVQIELEIAKAERESLEQAIKLAINSAFQEVARRNAELMRNMMSGTRQRPTTT